MSQGANEIKMDYPLMDEMKKTFQTGREQLQDTMQELKGIADKMEQGALKGDAGQTFTEGIRNDLLGAVQKISDKFEELEGDIDYAVSQMHEAEDKAKQSMSG